MRLVGSVAATLALFLPSVAQPTRTLDNRTLSPAAVHAELERWRAATGSPGLAVALIRDGQVVSVESAGVRDMASGAPLTAETVMRGASLTKAAFSYLVMQLVDEGRIDLDRPIADYLPAPLPNYPGYAALTGDPRWRRLTFRILLDHTSGFANYRSFEDDKRLRFHWSPGARYGYSGEGINLAQFVLEQGLHLDLEGEMQRRVFERFGMTRSSLIWPDPSPAEVATGYDDEDAPVPYEHTMAAHAASSLLTTPRDYARFLAGVLRGDGLSPAARTEMTRLQVAIHSRTQFPTLAAARTDAYRGIRLGYGLGWGVFDNPLRSCLLQGRARRRGGELRPVRGAPARLHPYHVQQRPGGGRVQAFGGRPTRADEPAVALGGLCSTPAGRPLIGPRTSVQGQQRASVWRH